MTAAKPEVSLLAESSLGKRALEDRQYGRYVLDKIRRGTERAAVEGVLSQAQVEARLKKWLVA